MEVRTSRPAAAKATLLGANSVMVMSTSSRKPDSPAAWQNIRARIQSACIDKGFHWSHAQPAGLRTKTAEEDEEVGDVRVGGDSVEQRWVADGCGWHNAC